MAGTRGTPPHHIACLDGLRGLAALWVLVGHALLLTGWRIKLIGDPDLGVDLFIMLSGFLMIFNYPPDSIKHPWSQFSSSTDFWKRRFFRIAPLYYILLFIALIFGPYLFESRSIIDAFLGVTPQLPERYLDSGFANFAMHLSFLFGMSPEYSYRTALPDWSIGLEMQFYAIFPFLTVLIRSQGWVRSGVAIVVVAIAIFGLLRISGIDFPMPSFLPLKMHVFVSGMLLAGALHSSRQKTLIHFLMAAMFVLIPIGGDVSLFKEAVRLIIVIGFFLLVHHAHLPRYLSSAFEWVGTNVFGSRFARLLGELSYGSYLIHLLVLQPVIAKLVIVYGHQMTNPARFAAAVLITLPIVYTLAAIALYWVEKPGQRLGKAILRPRLSEAKNSIS